VVGRLPRRVIQHNTSDYAFYISRQRLHGLTVPTWLQCKEAEDWSIFKQ